MYFKGTRENWELKKLTNRIIIGESIADVWGFDAHIDSKAKEEMEANALLISKAPEMLQELQETLKDLLCIQGSIYDSSRIDARWEGAYDVIQKQIDRKKELIKQATEL